MHRMGDLKAVARQGGRDRHCGNSIHGRISGKSRVGVVGRGHDLVVAGPVAAHAQRLLPHVADLPGYAAVVELLVIGLHLVIVRPAALLYMYPPLPHVVWSYGPVAVAA